MILHRLLVIVNYQVEKSYLFILWEINLLYTYNELYVLKLKEIKDFTFKIDTCMF